jgi:hypothetical protein
MTILQKQIVFILLLLTNVAFSKDIIYETQIEGDLKIRMIIPNNLNIFEKPNEKYQSKTLILKRKKSNDFLIGIAPMKEKASINEVKKYINEYGYNYLKKTGNNKEKSIQLLKLTKNNTVIGYYYFITDLTTKNTGYEYLTEGLYSVNDALIQFSYYSHKKNTILPKSIKKILLNIEILSGENEWAILKKTNNFTKDFTSPQGAVLCLEDAYRAKDIKKILNCRDFKLTYQYIFKYETSKNFQFLKPEEEVILRTAKDTENLYINDLKKSIPDFSVVIKSEFPRMKIIDKDFLILEEICTLNNGKITKQQLIMGKNTNGWKMLMPRSDILFPHNI